MKAAWRPALGLALPVLIVVVWAVAADARWLSPDALPPPLEVVKAARAEIESGRFWDAVGHSLSVAVLGWLAATLLGVAAGVAIGLSPLCNKLTGTSIEFARAVPAVALVPVAILIFGFDLRAELLVVVFAAVWPVLVNSISAMRLIPSQLDETARTLELAPVERIWKVLLPAAMPRIFVGVRLALATAVTLMAVAEMTGNPAGIGNELVLAQSSVRPEAAMLYILTIGLIGLGLNMLLVGGGRLPVVRRVLGATT